MAPEDFVPDIDRLTPLQPVGGEQRKVIPPGGGFQELMKPTEGLTGKAGVPSPFELTQGRGVVPGQPSVDTLLTQVNMAQTTMGDLNTQLNTPNLKLNRAQRYLVGNKLADAKAQIRGATSKLGVPETPEKELAKSSNPLVKFINLLTDGQHQLQAAKTQLETMKDSGEPLHPADFLLIQVKLNKAQVQIEYASILLAKAVEAMKQMFNIQL